MILNIYQWGAGTYIFIGNLSRGWCVAYILVVNVTFDIVIVVIWCIHWLIFILNSFKWYLPYFYQVTTRIHLLIIINNTIFIPLGVS